MGIEAYKIFKASNEMRKESEEKYMKYVRDDAGYIAKIRYILCEGYPVKELEGWIICDDNVKSIINPEKCKISDNIKNLIQLGDIVEWEFKDSSFIAINEVIQRPETGDTLGVYVEESDYLAPLEDIEILRILTKEQFEEYSYKVGKKDESRYI